MARLFARLFAFVLGVAVLAPTEAQTTTYTFYVGNTNASGCTVQTPAGAVGHVKWRLQATVTAGALPSVGGFTRSDCNNNVFGAPSAVSSTSAIGLNTGPGGSDVIEAQLPVGVVGPTPSPREVLAVVATQGANADAIVATVFAKDAVKGFNGGAPVTIPTAGVFALAALAAVLGFVAWRVLRRRAHLLILSLVFVAGSAWAVAIVVDGLIADWAGVAGNGDPAGDSGGAAAIDLRAMYVTTQGGNGYLRVDVTDLENPPVANATSATVLEDGSVAITLTATDPNNAPLAFQIASAPTQGTLGPVTPVNASSASVTYTPNADDNGSDSFTFTASNANQTSTPATVSISITPVNDAPSFSAAVPAAVNEGAGAQSIAGWASFVAGPANESAQAVQAYAVSNLSNPALFASAPAVDASGTLTYTPAADASGTATFDVAVQDNGGTANGGIDTSAVQAFAITVNAVNDAPSFTGGGHVAVAEDAGATSLAGWATNLEDGDPDATQSLAFQVTGNSHAALFASGPAVDAAGTLAFTPAADANGSATITLVLADDGGTANGGADTSAAYQFDITVSAVNDAPSFDASNPPAVNENAGAQSIANWAAFDPGPDNESTQSVLAYTVGAIANPALFAVAPSVAADGTLSYTAAAGASGSASFTVTVQDDGGTAGGGVDTSAAQSFTITVNAVNSAPSFTGGGDVASDEDAGPQTVAAWATNIDDGDPEVQNLAFTVTGNSNPALFASAPSVSAASGDLSYTAAPDASGSATLTLVLSDDGGSANGGSDASAPYQFTITVDAVNDAPTATPKAHATHSAIELEIVAAAHTGELLEGAADPDGALADLTAVLVAGSETPAGAQVTITDAASGSFRYDPPGGYSGAGGFQFRVCDDGAPQQCSAPTAVAFTVTGPELYFVDDDAAAGGDGGLNDPFASLADLPAGRGAGDRIYVHAGDYASGHALQAGEHVIGQGHGGDAATHLGVVAVGNGTLDALPAAGVAPTVGGTVTFGGNGGLLRGVAIDTGGDGVTAGAVSDITVLETSLAAGGTAARFDGTGASAAGVVFTSTTSTGGVNGIALHDVSGQFDFGEGALGGHSGASFLGTGTLGTVTYAGSIGKTAAGHLVELSGAAAGSVSLSGDLACSGSCGGIDVRDRGAGTITFSGESKVLATGAQAAVELEGNAGASVHFTGGGLDIDTTTGAGFRATGGAVAITVQGSGNTIDSANGPGLAIEDTPIGAQHATFERISSGAGAHVGIRLAGTGAAGRLVVTGSGSAGSGGIIAGKTGPDGSTTAGTGIWLEDTANVELRWMQLHDFQNSGIAGRNVAGFTLADSTIGGVVGSQPAGVEGPLNFGTPNPAGSNGLQGAGVIRNTRISGGIEHNVEFYNTSGAMDLVIEGVAAVSAGADPGSPLDDVADCVIEENSAASGSDGLLLEMQGTATATVRVSRCLFRDNKSQAIQAGASDAADVVLAIEDSHARRFDQGVEGVVISNAAGASLAARVSGNRFDGFGGTAIFAGQAPANASAASQLDATVTGNTITMPAGSTNHAIIGFATSSAGQPAPARLQVSGNVIVNDSTSGLVRGVLIDTPDALTSPDLDARVSGNQVTVNDGTTGVGGVVVQARQGATLCSAIDGNVVAFPNGTPPGVNGLRARRVAPAVHDTESSAGCAGTAAQVIACRNPSATTEVLGTIGVVAQGSCQTPVAVP